MTKERRRHIKDKLRTYIPKLETLKVYNDQARAYRMLYDVEGLDSEQRQEYVDILKKMIVINKEIGELKAGLQSLNNVELAKDKEIVEYKYLYGYSDTKIGYLTGYSENGVRKRLYCIYDELDKYID